MKIVALTVSLILLVPALAVQAMSVSREVVCYHFRGVELERRDICTLQDSDTSSKLTWSDGVETRIRWVSRYADSPTLDEVPARAYERDPQTLEIVDRPTMDRPIQCLQVLASNHSVCWSH